MTLRTRKEFSDFDTELEDFEVKKASTLITRLYSVGSGGSIHCMSKTQDGIVYFGSADQYIYAVDCITGKAVWKYKTDGKMVGNSPVIHENVLYIGALSGSFYAIDIETGKKVWSFRAGEGATTKPLLYDDKIYFGCIDDNLYCLSLEGKEIWRFRTGKEIFYGPSVWEGKIYFGSGDGNFYCINSQSGKEIWRFRAGDEIWSESSSEIYNGVVYFSSVDNNLYALDAMNGKEIWRFRTGRYGNCSSPVVHEERVYHVSRDGILYALTLEGKEVWRFRADGLIAVGVMIDGGRIYFGSEDQNLYCLDLKTGKEIWRFKTSGQVWSPPVVWKNSLLFGSWDCHFYCIDFGGKEKWRFATSDKTISKVDPPYKIFEMVVKKSFDETEEIDEKYDLDFSGRSSDDVYSVKSEYVFETTYATKKDYGD